MCVKTSIQGDSVFRDVTLAEQMGADPGAAEPPFSGKGLLTNPAKG